MGGKALAGEEHAAQRGAAKQRLQHGSTAGQADIDFRHADRSLFRGVEDIAGSSQAEARAECNAIDGGNDRLGAFADGVRRLASDAVVFEEVTINVRIGAVLEVCAGTENLVDAGQHGAADVVALRERIKGGYDLPAHLAAERVDRAPVHRDQGDIVGYFKANKLLGHHSSPLHRLTDRSVSRCTLSGSGAESQVTESPFHAKQFCGKRGNELKI